MAYIHHWVDGFFTRKETEKRRKWNNQAATESFFRKYNFLQVAKKIVAKFFEKYLWASSFLVTLQDYNLQVYLKPQTPSHVVFQVL